MASSDFYIGHESIKVYISEARSLCLRFVGQTASVHVTGTFTGLAEKNSTRLTFERGNSKSLHIAYRQFISKYFAVFRIQAEETFIILVGSLEINISIAFTPHEIADRWAETAQYWLHFSALDVKQIQAIVKRIRILSGTGFIAYAAKCSR